MPRGLPVPAAIAALATSLAATLALGTADATRTIRVASHVTVTSRGLTFAGKVTSPNAACDSARKVTLYRAPSQSLGSTTTRSSGAWAITVSGSAGVSLGHFYATVKKRTEGTAGTIYVCKSARSKTIPFHQ